MYSVKDNTIYSHLFIGGKVELELGETRVQLEQQSSMPWEGKTVYKVALEKPASFALALRIPDWASGAEVLVNGEAYAISGHVVDGYAIIEREWASGDAVELVLEMPIMRIRSNPRVKYNAGKVALQRGPLVYCVEEADNGARLQQLMLEQDAGLTLAYDDKLAGGLMTIKAEALRLELENFGTELYRADSSTSLKKAAATFIPYYAWANRGKGEMTVWVNERV
ncbi:Non-reducing end beta-L-arabinofuranosidase [compost metagenome]